MLAEACPDCHVSTAEAAECCTTKTEKVLYGVARLLCLTASLRAMQIPLMRDPATMQSQCVGCHHFYSPAEVQVGSEQQLQSQPHSQTAIGLGPNREKHRRVCSPSLQVPPLPTAAFVLCQCDFLGMKCICKSQGSRSLIKHPVGHQQYVTERPFATLTRQQLLLFAGPVIPSAGAASSGTNTSQQRPLGRHTSSSTR